MEVFFIVLAILAIFEFSLFASAHDPSPLQDFCVAVDEPVNGVFMNGRFYKDPRNVTANDFLFGGLDELRSTINRVGSNVTMINVDLLPGLNTMGVSLAHIDYAPYGVNPPHRHPRATELIMCSRGTLYVGFVSSNQNGNRFFTRIFRPGDLFVFPFGMIHFQFNIGKSPVVAFSSFSSQNPGVITIANALFGANPPINLQVLANSFKP